MNLELRSLFYNFIIFINSLEFVLIVFLIERFEEGLVIVVFYYFK